MANIELILTPASPTGSMIFTLGAPGPQGIPGPAGAQGVPGVPGSPGVGVPDGGTTGQYLVKSTDVDYETEWASLSLAGYALESWVTTYFYPRTGNPDGFATQAWVIGQNYLTVGSLAAYATMAWVNNELTIYATQSWVTGQGYITASALTPYLTSATAASTYAVIAAGQPTSGTVGQVLTKSSGTNYDSGWQTLIPGDRYLTTSTTSNAVSNGAKTFTVGTGLSYTTQQDVTIAYDATRHMHARVTSYDSGTGVLVVDVTNHTGTGTYTAWTVNVGGAVPLASVVWGDITGTLGNQSDLATALNDKLNLSGGTMTGDITMFDSLASYNEITALGLHAYVLNGQAVASASIFTSTGVQCSTPGSGESYLTPNYISAYDEVLNQTTEIYGGQISIQNSGGNLTLSATGLTFPDATVQTTAALPLSGGNITTGSSYTNLAPALVGVAAVSVPDFAYLEPNSIKAEHAETDGHGAQSYVTTVTAQQTNFAYSGNGPYGGQTGTGLISYSGASFGYNYSAIVASGTISPNGTSGSVNNMGTTATWSLSGSGLTWNNGTAYGEFNSSGVRFPDGTTQNTAATSGIPDAPSDGNTYARQNAGWASFSPGIGDAPSDSQFYARVNGGWSTFSSGISDAPSDGATYARQNSSWTAFSPGLSSPPYSDAVWAYNNWYQASVRNVYDPNFGQYYNVLSF